MSKTCVFAALFCILVTPMASAQSPMSQEEVLKAIALGRYGNPKPYEATLNGWHAGAGVVYTPFVRVAMAARLARDTKRPFGLEDVRPWMSSPEVWVALRWYPRDAPGRYADLVEQAKAEHQRPVVMLGPSGFGPKQLDGRDPLWSKGPEALAPLGPLPFEDIIAVAAFPREALVPGHDIVVYYRVPSPTGTIVYPIRVMRLEEGVIGTWR